MLAPIWSRISGRVALGIAGLSFGVASFLIAGYALVELLGTPQYLVALYHAFVDVRTQRVNDFDVYAIAQFVAALLSVFGTAVLALVLSYLGVPLRVKGTDNGDPALGDSTKRSP